MPACMPEQVSRRARHGAFLDNRSEQHDYRSGSLAAGTKPSCCSPLAILAQTDK